MPEHRQLVGAGFVNTLKPGLPGFFEHIFCKARK